jgi:hypothetical protein
LLVITSTGASIFIVAIASLLLQGIIQFLIFFFLLWRNGTVLVDGVRIWLTASLAVSSVIFLMAPFSAAGSFLSEQAKITPPRSIAAIKPYESAFFKKLHGG